MSESLKPWDSLLTKCRLCALALFAATTLVSCTIGSGPVTSYGNVHFQGSGTIDRMSICPGPPPKNITITLNDGRKLPLPSIRRDEIVALFGEPTSAWQVDNGKSKFEEFGQDGYTIHFKDGAFEALYLRDRPTITNLDNNKSVTLPATEADIRKVMGKPT